MSWIGAATLPATSVPWMNKEYPSRSFVSEKTLPEQGMVVMVSSDGGCNLQTETVSSSYNQRRVMLSFEITGKLI